MHPFCPLLCRFFGSQAGENDPLEMIAIIFNATSIIFNASLQQRIKILQKQLCWIEVFYRDTLAANFQGRCSCKALSAREAGEWMGLLEQLKPLQPSQRTRFGVGKHTHSDLNNQAGDGGTMRTAKQLRTIEEIYYASPNIEAKTPQGLNAFCAEILKHQLRQSQRQAKHLRWLTRREASQIIVILQKSYS